MSEEYKELKSLIDVSERLKEELKTHAMKIKQAKSYNRVLIQETKKYSECISELELNSKTSNKIETFKAISNSELELYHSVFAKLATTQLFDNLIRNPGKHSKKNTIPVDVQFEGVSITFFITAQDTFLTLRKHAASYWALPLDEIFFSDVNPAEGPQALFMMHINVLEELYAWNNIKIKGQNFLLFLVLRGYSSLSEKMDEVFPREIKEVNEMDHTEIDINVHEIFKKKVLDLNPADEKISYLKKRKFWHRAQYACQWAMYLTLFILWNFILSQDYDTERSVWINRRVTQVFLWNFQYNDFTTTSMYGLRQNEFLSVTSIDTIWDYIEGVQKKVTNGYDVGVLSNHIYGLEYIELRQLRTDVNQCDFEGIFNYTCSDKYSIAKGYTKDLGTEGYQKYEKRDKSIFIYGEFALYPNNGYLNHVDLQDNVDWYKNISALKASGWIDQGTRAVFISINFYNPDSDIFSLIMPYFELQPSGVILPNFRSYCFKAHLFSGNNYLGHGFIFVLILILFLLELRQNVRHPEEIQVFIYEKSEIEQEKFHDILKNYHKLNFFQRLKKPTRDQMFSLFTLLLAFILEIIGISMHLGRFKQASQINIGYNNLYATMQGVSILNDSKTIMTFFLALNVIRYIIIWLSEVNRFFLIIIELFSHIGYYIVLCLIPILVFAAFFFYLLGPSDSAFNSMEKSFVSTIQILCGRWPSNKKFLNFIDPGYLVLILFVFKTWKFYILTIQSILFQFGMAKAKHKLLY